MERLTNGIDRRTMLTVILLTIPFYCLGVFAWSISPTKPIGDPTSDQFSLSSETPVFTETPPQTDQVGQHTSTPKPTKTTTSTITKTVTPTVTATRTLTITPSPTNSVTPSVTLPPTQTLTSTVQPTATEQVYEFFTPTNLPDDILTIVP